jgi:hypothetical protein
LNCFETKKKKKKKYIFVVMISEPMKLILSREYFLDEIEERE